MTRIAFHVHRVLLLAGAIACGPLLAGQQEPDTPARYSHAMALTVSGKSTIVSVPLPPAVYQHARSAALADLRIFDATGKSVPFALMEPSARSQAGRRQLPVKIFPVGTAPGEQRAPRNVEVRTSDSGVVVSVGAEPARAATAPSGTEPGQLVLDIGQDQGARGAAIDALEFTLPPAVSNYHADVLVETSGDLRNWEEAGSGTLSWMTNSGGEKLSTNRMEFPSRVFRYARLTWRQGRPLQFAGIVAEAPVTATSAAPIATITLAPRPGRFKGDLVYDAGTAIPVRRLGLRFDQQNIVLPAQLGEYIELPSVKGDQITRWQFRPRMQAVFFHLTQNGKVRASGDIVVDEAHVAQWVLRPENASAAQPALQVSWNPASAVFMASGSAPFTLHVGRDKAASAQRPMEQVAPGFSSAELAQLEQAAIGTVRVRTAAAGPSDAEQAGAGARSRVLWLWGVLLLGVGALGAMVWKLMGQMKNPA